MIPCCNLKVLVPYRDGDLPAEEAREVEQHVASCGRCASRLRWIEFEGLAKRMRPLPESGAGSCLPAEAYAAYLNSALGREEAKAVEQHIGGCESCLEAMGLLEAASPSLPEEEVPRPTREALQRFSDLLRK